jgi:hypothetical protein
MTSSSSRPKFAIPTVNNKKRLSAKPPSKEIAVPASSPPSSRKNRRRSPCYGWQCPPRSRAWYASAWQRTPTDAGKPPPTFSTNCDGSPKQAPVLVPDSVTPVVPPVLFVVQKWLPAAVALVIGSCRRQFLATLRPRLVATRLAGTSTAFVPRISPHGQLPRVPHHGEQPAQVVIMNSDDSSWTILTTQKDAVYADEISWAADGSKLTFLIFGPVARRSFDSRTRRRATAA